MRNSNVPIGRTGPNEQLPPHPPGGRHPKIKWRRHAFSATTSRGDGRLPSCSSPYSSSWRGRSSRQQRAELNLPDLASVSGLRDDRATLLIGLFVCLLRLLFGLVMYTQLKNMPVHRSMREISELIYETCKTYLQTQGKFIMLLWVFIAAIILVYFGYLRHFGFNQVALIILFSLIGIAGSYGVAWFGIRINTFANSRSAFASSAAAVPTYAIPLKAGMSIGMLLISTELVIMLCILLFVPGDFAGPCFIASPSASRWRGSAGGRRRHLHQDRRHRLRPDEDRLQHQGRRRPQPRRHRRLHG
ncbi:MAG: sodium/proton-translocating pyrophosphatase [Thermoanaerobaculia bacterium]